jgi:hypothetical protein
MFIFAFKLKLLLDKCNHVLGMTLLRVRNRFLKQFRPQLKLLLRTKVRNRFLVSFLTIVLMSNVPQAGGVLCIDSSSLKYQKDKQQGNKKKKMSNVCSAYISSRLFHLLLL